MSIDFKLTWDVFAVAVLLVVIIPLCFIAVHRVLLIRNFIQQLKGTTTSYNGTYIYIVTLAHLKLSVVASL